MANPPALQPLTLRSWWTASYAGSSFGPSSVGYYTHKGRCYLAMVVELNPGGTSDYKPITVLPADARPASTVTLTALVVQGELPAGQIEAGFDFDHQWDVAIDPDGTVRLVNDPPPHTITAPDPAVYWEWAIVSGAYAHRPRYPNPFSFVLALGNESFAIGTGTDTIPAVVSLDDLVNWELDGSAPAGVVAHGSRIHLTGKLQSLDDDAGFQVTRSLPDDCLPAAKTNTRAQRVDNGDEIALFVDRFGDIYPDQPGFWPPPAGHSPWLTPSMPERVGSRMPADGTAGKPYNLVGGPDPTHGFWGAVTTHASKDNGWYGCGVDALGNDIHCPEFGPGPAFAVSLDDLLAQVSPAPDWFTIGLVMTGTCGTYTTHCTIDPDLGTGDCGANEGGEALGSPSYVMTATGVADSVGTTTGGFWHSGDTITTAHDGDSVVGWSQRFGYCLLPETPLYNGTNYLELDQVTFAFLSRALFKAGQVSGGFVMDFQHNVLNTFEGDLTLSIIPFWELPTSSRTPGGTTLDLTGSGFEGYTPPITTVRPGAAVGGVVAR